MRKRLISLILIAISIFSVSCGNKQPEITDSDSNKPTANSDKDIEKEEIDYTNDPSEVEEDLIKLYLYSASADKFFYVNTKLLEDDPDITNKLVTVLKSSPHKSLVANIPESTKINSITKKDDMAILDLSENFVTDSNVGSGVETNILQSITNTVGEALDVDKVKILLDGKPYASGHILMNEDEFFTVNTEGIEQFNVN